MKVLVTGGAGYIGEVAAHMLSEHGWDVTVLDDCSSNEPGRLPDGVRLVRARVHEAAEALDGVDVVFHFAGYIAAGESMQQPEKYWDANVTGTLDLLSAMHAAGVKRLVFSSSAAVYGNPEKLPVEETAPTAPTSTYGSTKLACDLAVQSHVAAHGLAAASLRYFNVAGAWKDGAGRWHGERHDPETHLIPLALRAASGEGEPLRLFGLDYDTPDGTCVRDYIHVGDLVQAHLLAAERLTEGRHDVFNLGNGNGFSNLEVIRAVEEVCGRPVPYTEAPRRPGDPARLVASSAKAQRDLDWRPSKSKLTDMIADAWEFCEQRD